MTDITDPQAVKFSNEELRKFADLLAGAYQQAKVIQIKWIAEGMGAKLPNAADEIQDGSAKDGRTVVYGSTANALKSVADQLVTLLEENANEDQITVVQYSVNPRA